MTENERLRESGARLLSRRDTIVAHKGKPRLRLYRKLKFEQMLQYLNQHWHKPINVEDLAAAARLSRRGLFKSFERRMGHGPGRELRCIRIRQSQQLLAKTDWRLNVVAKACGFKSLNSFWVAFKREVGMTPGVFRREFSQTTRWDRTPGVISAGCPLPMDVMPDGPAHA